MCTVAFNVLLGSAPPEQDPRGPSDDMQPGQPRIKKPCMPRCVWGDAVCRALLGDPSRYSGPCETGGDHEGDRADDEADASPTEMLAPALRADA